MRKNRIKHGFTLVEILIVLVVLALLIGVLFKVYQSITEISFRVRYEKTLGNSIVTMQTILQNIADADTVDYSGLQQSWNPSWWLTSLPLRTVTWKATLSLESWQLLLTTYSGNETNVASILGADIVIKNATFILSPVTDPSKERSFANIYQPGFWLIWSLEATSYPWMHFPVHTFFSFLQK